MDTGKKLKEIQNYNLGLDTFEKAKKSDSFQTDLAKNKMIKALKGKMGQKIKKNPNEVVIKEIPWYIKLKVKLLSIYWVIRITIWDRK